MDARTEQKDLIANPLPSEELVRVPEDDTLPTRIYQLDQQYAELQNTAMLNREARAVLMDRAVKLKAYKDESTGIYIHKKEKNLPRKINVPALEEKYPLIYHKAVAIERENALQKAQEMIEKVDEAGKDIRIKTLDVLMSKTEIDDVYFPHEVSVTWEVKKMKTAISSPIWE